MLLLLSQAREMQFQLLATRAEESREGSVKMSVDERRDRRQAINFHVSLMQFLSIARTSVIINGDQCGNLSSVKCELTSISSELSHRIWRTNFELGAVERFREFEEFYFAIYF